MEKRSFTCEICGEEVFDIYQTVDFEKGMELKYRFNACPACSDKIFNIISEARLLWINEEK
jgi:DNA-directed RNA polymerase subunit RPC12/RpoP